MQVPPSPKCASKPARPFSSAAKSIVLSADIHPFSIAKRVTARYRAPESRYVNPKCFAISFANVLFPVEE